MPYGLIAMMKALLLLLFGYFLWTAINVVRNQGGERVPVAISYQVDSTEELVSSVVSYESNGTLHLLWTPDGQGVYLVTSQDGGESWSQTRTLDDSRAHREIALISATEEKRDQSTLVALWHRDEGLVSRRSTDGGRSWDTSSLLMLGREVGVSRTLAGQGKTLAAVFHNAHSGDGGEIRLAASDDAGQSWIGPIEVATVSPGAIVEHVSIAVREEQVAAIWMESDRPNEVSRSRPRIWFIEATIRDGVLDAGVPVNLTESFVEYVGREAGWPYLCEVGVSENELAVVVSTSRNTQVRNNGKAGVYSFHRSLPGGPWSIQELEWNSALAGEMVTVSHPEELVVLSADERVHVGQMSRAFLPTEWWAYLPVLGSARSIISDNDGRPSGQRTLAVNLIDVPKSPTPFVQGRFSAVPTLSLIQSPMGVRATWSEVKQHKGSSGTKTYIQVSDPIPLD